MEDTVVLQMRGIKKAFPGVQALDGVDLEVRSGEVMALVGENGAGKSTLIKILSGAYTADAGEIYLSEDVYNFPGVREAVAGCQIASERVMVKGISGTLQVYQISSGPPTA